jgi:hypothetical protein
MSFIFSITKDGKYAHSTIHSEIIQVVDHSAEEQQLVWLRPGRFTRQTEAPSAKL